VRLRTRLRNQTELMNTTEAEGEKGVWVGGVAVGMETLALGLESCWDISARRDWVTTLGSWRKLG
jgi:hypothetical protein